MRHIDPFKDRSPKSVAYGLLRELTVEDLRSATPIRFIQMGVKAGMENQEEIELLNKYPNGEIPE